MVSNDPKQLKLNTVDICVVYDACIRTKHAKSKTTARINKRYSQAFFHHLGISDFICTAIKVERKE